MNWQAVKQIENTIIEHRRHIHKYPELGFREHNTHAYITQYLTKLNIKHETICSTGIVAIIGDADKHSDNCIAFRTELDALPIQEDTGLPFASIKEGMMHACGHDMHIAMLLGAAEILQHNVNKLNCAVKLIFQPGEEVLPGGAIKMLQHGCFQNPAPKMIFAGHVDPCLETGAIEVAPNAAMATTCEITIKVLGTATHGSTPHLGSDPLLVAAAIVNFAQSFVARYNDPLQPAVLSICATSGGTANNAFPKEVTMLGTLRSFSEDNRDRLLHIFEQKVQALCAVYDTTCEMGVVLGYPPVVNNAAAVDIVAAGAAQLAADNVKFGLCLPKMWAEDFAYYAKVIPACFYFIGCRGQVAAALHSNNLTPNEQALAIGTALIVNIVKAMT